MSDEDWRRIIQWESRLRIAHCRPSGEAGMTTHLMPALRYGVKTLSFVIGPKRLQRSNA